MSERIVDCPGCQGPSVFAASNPYRPFCSLRCREADLGAWASESYRVEAVRPPQDEDAVIEPPPRPSDKLS